MENGECMWILLTSIKTCPKYNFPLPKIDRLVDFIAVFEYLSPLDANSGYHQTPMHPDYEEKIVFITDQGIFCYRTMPFILKNVGATYQKMVNKVFKNQNRQEHGSLY